MSKSPAKDFSRLLQTNAKTNIKTVKKQEGRRYEIDLPPRYETSAILNDLRTKLDLSLMNNSRLLDENSSLGEMVTNLKFELKSATQKFNFIQKESDDLLRKTSNERQNLTLEIEIKQKSHEEELEKLLREISILHDQKNSFQIERQRQIESLKNQFQKTLVAQLQNMRSCQNNSKDLYEAQIRNLKELLDEKSQQIQNIKALDKLQKNRLSDQIKYLEKQTKHLRHSYAIEIQGLKNAFEHDFNSEKKKIENEKELELSAYAIKIRRLKKQMLEKNLQLQHLNKKMSHQDEMISIESEQFKKQKQNLLSQLKGNDIHHKNTLTREKTKLGELNRLEVQNLVKIYETNIEELNGENYKLKQLIECKKEQIRDIYDENQRIKDSFGQQNQLLRNQNEDLKNKIKSLQFEYKQQMETFKIKMAQLLEADIKNISTYYENQIKTYIDKTYDLEKINKDIKQKLYNSIHDNDEVRKNFEIEISKQRARVQDLKIKIASIQLEHKEHVSNLGSKVQLTSQTLIREAEHKDKSKTQYDEEKRKFHYLANSKDKQISELMKMMQGMKKMHEDELKVNRAEKLDLKSQLEEKESEIKKIKLAAEQQLKSKDDRLKNLSFSNQKQMQQIKQLEDKIEVLEKNNIKLKKQLDHMNLVNASIAQELGLSKGFIQNLQLQSSAAIQDERSKLKAFLGTHQISIRQYFEDKIKSRERDNQNLQKLLSVKQDDIRDLIVKYNALQKRLEMMLEAQNKLSQFQEKIKNLGLDNNLVKNMAELFKK